MNLQPSHQQRYLFWINLVILLILLGLFSFKCISDLNQLKTIMLNARTHVEQRRQERLSYEIQQVTDDHIKTMVDRAKPLPPIAGLWPDTNIEFFPWKGHPNILIRFTYTHVSLLECQWMLEELKDEQWHTLNINQTNFTQPKILEQSNVCHEDSTVVITKVRRKEK